MMSRFALGLALVAGLSGCAIHHPHYRAVPVAAPPHCSEGAEEWARTELYFGLSRPDGTEIGAAEFADFVDREVTPRFPEGLSLLAADGQWRGGDGTIVKEESRVLMLLHPGTPEAIGRLEEIRGAYLEAFDQKSVLRVDGASCVSF